MIQANMRARCIYVAVGVLFSVGISPAYSARCRICHQANSLEDCTSWASCAVDEACYMEEVITVSARVVYNGGCKAKTNCQTPVQSTNGVNTTCSKCCDNADFCNEGLCGIHKATNLTICNQCNGHSSAFPPKYPEDCPQRTVCQANEMCFASTYTHGDNSLRHVTECRNKQVCQTLTSYILQLSSQSGVGKRDKAICAVCCGDDMCNQYACETIKRRLSNLDINGFLDRQTLKEII